MFDFVNDRTQDKGLFTFYRQQAQMEQKAATEKSKSKENMQKWTLGQMRKLKNRYGNDSIIENKQESQMNVNIAQKYKHKKSFDQLNKELIRRLSLKNQASFDASHQQLGSEVVVIRKANSFKQKSDISIQKQNERYQMKGGHFIKQKIFDPLQQRLLLSRQKVEGQNQFSQSVALENTARSERTVQEFLARKKRMKRNQSHNDKYHSPKINIQNQLILGRGIMEKHEGSVSPKLQPLKKVDLQSSFSELQQNATIIQTHRNHHVHKRIPPKVLASILKNQNHEIIKHLRKELEKQKEEQIKISMNRKHSFIEYGSQDFQKSGLDATKLNEKQRRLVTILNKFQNMPFAKVFIN